MWGCFHTDKGGRSCGLLTALLHLVLKVESVWNIDLYDHYAVVLGR
jgi:hypothetical protein